MAYPPITCFSSALGLEYLFESLQIINQLDNKKQSPSEKWMVN